MHLMRILIVLLCVNLVTPVLAETTAKIRGPKEFDAPAITQIGPITPQDTLWRLAEQVRPDPRVNMYQVMYALYLKNPNSFLDNNFNHLRTGAYLQVPTLREMLNVDAVEAQRKSELDDLAWSEKIRLAAQQKKEDLTAKQQDIAAARQEIKEELSRVESVQTEQMSDIRDRLSASMANVEAIVQENEKLKDQLGAVAQELTTVKQQLDQDSEIQKQLQQLLAQQAEMMAQQQEQIRKAQEGFNFAETWQKLANSPVGWALAGLLPASIILFFIVAMIRRKGQKAAAVVTAATAAPVADPYYKSPLPPLDDSLDFDESSLMNLDDSLLNDRNGGIRLDEDDFNRPPARKAASFNDDDLLDDSFDTPSAATSKPASAFDMDDLLDDPLDLSEPTPAAPTPKVEFDANNILSGDDLSALFSEAEDEPFVAKTEFDANNILSGNELSSLFDSLEEDDEDPDAIFAKAQANQKAESHLVPDDLDKASSVALAAAEAAQMDDLLEEIELDLPGDSNVTDDFDIDSLLDSTQSAAKAQEPAPTAAQGNSAADDSFDIDDLLASTQSAQQSPSDETFDIDDVIAAAKSEDNSDNFDIDDLVAATQATAIQVTAPQAAAAQVASTQANDEFDIDDLIDQSQSHDNLTAPKAASESVISEMAENSLEKPEQFDSSELDAFAESLVDETLLSEPDFTDFIDEQPDNVHQIMQSELDTDADAIIEADEQHVLHDELDDILNEVAELKAQSAATLAELKLPEAALEQAAADFADAEISMADVSHLLTDDDMGHNAADDLSEVEKGSAVDSLSAANSIDAADDLSTTEDLAFDMPAELSDTSETEQAFELQELASQAHESNDEVAGSVESSASGDLSLSEVDATTEQELAQESFAEQEYLNEFAELEDAEMPNLALTDDGSVAKFEPISSVERPSKLLDSYPELELSDLDLSEDGDLIFDEDELTNGSVVDVDAALLDELLQEPADLPEMAELGAIEETNFDELLQELAEVELPSEDEIAESLDLHDLTVDEAFNQLATSVEDDPAVTPPELPDFVNIDRLLAATEEDVGSHDPTAPLNIDVGLADFDDLILPEEAGDVDAADNGFGGKMDLIRAYIEIGDQESANQIIKDIMASDAPAHVKQEALSLQS